MDTSTLLVLLPALEYLLSFQRARLIITSRTRLVTLATAVEAIALAAALYMCVSTFGLVGALAAAIAVILGRLAANGLLFFPEK